MSFDFQRWQPTRRHGLLAALLAMLQGCAGVETLDRLVPADTYLVHQGVAYGDDARHQLDVYRPLHATPGSGHPMVVFFYGGSWTSGERREYRFVGEALASRGAVVVVADYRLSPAHRYPSFVQDSARAVAWALRHAAELQVDPARVYVMGHSAGAYNAAMVALDPRWLGEWQQDTKALAGWIGLAGPYEFLPIKAADVKVAFNWPETPRDSQPVHHVRPNVPRSLLIAPRHDNLVASGRNTEALAELLQQAGADVQLRIWGQVSHVTLMASLARPLRFMSPLGEELSAFIGLPTKAR